MIVMRVPQPFATNDNYSAGPDVGTPTKVDPSTPGNGFVAGTAIAPQHVNWALGGLAPPARRALGLAALRARLVNFTFSDTANALAAIHLENGGLSRGIGALAIKTDATLLLNDSALPTSLGAIASITSLVTSAAQNASSRILAVGTGGNNNTYSDDYGATWSAGGAIGFVPQDVVWNATLGLFLCNSNSGSSVARSTNGASWATATHSLSVSGQGGIAVLSNGRTVICGNDGGSFPRFTVSSNGSSWSDSGGFPADGGIAFQNEGYICGNGGDVVWHVGVRGSPGSALRISTSADGVTWTTRADLTTLSNNIPPAAIQPTIKPRILCCQNTGLLVVLGCQVANSRIFAIASADAGYTWTDPVFFRGASMGAFAVADGKLFRTVGGALEQSDGISW